MPRVDMSGPVNKTVWANVWTDEIFEFFDSDYIKLFFDDRLTLNRLEIVASYKIPMYSIVTRISKSGKNQIASRKMGGGVVTLSPEVFDTIKVRLIPLRHKLPTHITGMYIFIDADDAEQTVIDLCY